MYNSKDCIERCLDSLINQTLSKEKFEVIIVDDHSTDSSLDLVEQYKKNSSLNLQIITHRKNRGPGGARNTALECAVGTYLAFIDADDTYTAQALQYYLELIIESQAELLTFPFISSKDGKLFHENNPRDALFEKEKTIDNNQLHRHPSFIFSQHAWNKIYHRDLIKKLHPFPEKQRYNEDAWFSFEAFTVANRISFSDKAYYIYHKDLETSSTRNTLTAKESYQSHFNHIEKLFHYSSMHPEVAKPIFWYALRNWQPFIGHILEGSSPLSEQESISLFTKTKEIFKRIPKEFKAPDGGLLHYLTARTMRVNHNLPDARAYYKKRKKILACYYPVKKIILFWRT